MKSSIPDSDIVYWTCVLTIVYILCLFLFIRISYDNIPQTGQNFGIYFINVFKASGDASLFRIMECVDDYYNPGPITKDILVRSFFSVEYQETEEHTSQCRVRYLVPFNATVYQGMRASHQQHGDNFTYEYDTYRNLGHHVTTINGVKGHDTTHWALHHGETLESAEYGVDHLHIEDEDIYLWRYTDYDDGEFDPFNSTECHTVVDDIIPALPFTDVAVYLSVSTQNTASFTNGSFVSAMCKRLILTEKTSTLYDVTLAANDQAITSFFTKLDSDDYGIIEVNGLINQGGYTWRIFDVLSQDIFPTDLTLTTIQDGGHYEYRFTEDDLYATQPYDVTTESKSERMKFNQHYIIALITIFMAIAIIDI
ncbi:uncharacterized protein LOC121409274 isoform X2 [Lytechinus variegatus]|uniref:uncharacterized protein LOC121409274 isoform X2 n=1 Tax=Lytechinus variegatus TaxID=7654 RepID=UPI001BB16270|nr:uncharacterized protein LOC121409274 isoform X2 [Lytechinus variegatus]